MLTSNDIRKLVDSFSAIFATKLELQEEIHNFREEMNFKFQDVLTKLDVAYKELHDMRLEQNMHVLQHRDIRDDIDELKSSIHPN